MAIQNKLRSILAVLAVVMLVCSFAMPFVGNVRAEAVTKADVEAYYAENMSKLQQAGLKTEEYEGWLALVNVDEGMADLVYERLSLYVDCAEKSGAIATDYADEKVETDYLGKDRAKIKNLRDTALAKLKIESADLVNGDSIDAAKNRLQTVVSKFNTDVSLFATTYEAEFTSYKQGVLDQFESTYRSLAAETEAFLSDKTETDKSVYDYQSLNSSSYYTAKNFADLKNAYAIGLNSIYAYVFETDAGATVAQKQAALERIKNEAVANLKVVPHNAFDVCYYAYNDYHSVYGDETVAPEVLAERERSFLEKWNALNADGGYWKSLDSSVENQKKVKNGYEGKYSAMSKFIVMNTGYDPYTQIEYKQVSELVDSTGVITVTAYFVDDSGNYILDGGKKVRANVFTTACRLKSYDVANGALKRNATTAIRKLDEKLGASYFISVQVYKGNNEYAFVKANADGSPKKAHWLVEIKDTEGNVTGYNDRGEYSVVYEVAVDLDSYCEEFGVYQKDKIENVKKASDRIAGLGAGAEGLSLCYGYSQGEVEKLSYEFDNEGGNKIVFATTHFSTFCIAGIETENLLINPLFWVAVLLALIVVIAIIKLIVKHVKYTIRFITNGGMPVAPIKASKNEYFVMPAPPVKDGFVFAGWFVDKECTVRFIETHMRRRKGYKLYAKWAAPVTGERLAEFYDGLRDLMFSYEKRSFKSVMGVTAKERLASIAGGKTYVTLYLALNGAEIKKEGYLVEIVRDKKKSDVPVKMIISTEENYANALELTRRVLLEKGLQKKDEWVAPAPSTAAERATGLDYYVENERVAKTAEDYFELLRIALKSYVLEENNGKFADGEKRTFARVFINNEVACLYLNSIKNVKGLSRGESSPRFADTPVLFKVLTAKDLAEAYVLIDKMMTYYGFVKCPENANDLKDVNVPTTNGFAYTIKF